MGWFKKVDKDSLDPMMLKGIWVEKSLVKEVAKYHNPKDDGRWGLYPTLEAKFEAVVNRLGVVFEEYWKVEGLKDRVRGLSEEVRIDNLSLKYTETYKRLDSLIESLNKSLEEKEASLKLLKASNAGLVKKVEELEKLIKGELN